jgi:hypothetical protein
MGRKRKDERVAHWRLDCGNIGRVGEVQYARQRPNISRTVVLGTNDHLFPVWPGMSNEAGRSNKRQGRYSNK